MSEDYYAWRWTTLLYAFVMASVGWVTFGVLTGFCFGLFRVGYTVGGAFWN